MKIEIKKWLEKAKQDFDTAKYNLNGGKIEAGVFFLQQSAEKALKAVYIKKFKRLIRVHDLVLLSKRINAPKKIINFCKELNPAYQYTRYPDIPLMGDLELKANEFVKHVEEILKWCMKNI